MGCHLGSAIAVFTKPRINSHKHTTRWQQLAPVYHSRLWTQRVSQQSVIIFTESAKRSHQEHFNTHMNTINTRSIHSNTTNVFYFRDLSFFVRNLAGICPLKRQPTCLKKHKVWSVKLPIDLQIPPMLSSAFRFVEGGLSGLQCQSSVCYHQLSSMYALYRAGSCCLPQK